MKTIASSRESAVILSQWSKSTILALSSEVGHTLKYGPMWKDKLESLIYNNTNFRLTKMGFTFLWDLS